MEEIIREYILKKFENHVAVNIYHMASELRCRVFSNLNEGNCTSENVHEAIKPLIENGTVKILGKTSGIENLSITIIGAKNAPRKILDAGNVEWNRTGNRIFDLGSSYIALTDKDSFRLVFWDSMNVLNAMKQLKKRADHTLHYLKFWGAI